MISDRDFAIIMKEGRNVPKDMLRAVHQEQRLDPLEEELYHRSIENAKKISDPLKRREVMAYLEKGKPTPHPEEENSLAAARLGLWWDTRMKKLFESGKISRPNPRDTFVRRIDDKMAMLKRLKATQGQKQ